MPVQLDAVISIGASGAPTIVSAPLISSITRLAAGQYRLQLNDNYAKLLDFRGSCISAQSGISVTAGSFVVGTVYRITALGNTTQAQWVAAGVPVGITAAVGVTFKAAAAGAGTGTAQTLASSGIASIELMSNSINMLNNQPFQALNGGYVDFQCLGQSFTAGAYTPSGSVSAPIFTGSAMAAHSHTIPVTAGTAGDPVTNNAGVLESAGGEDLTSSSDSAGTPAGTNSAPIFTGDAASLSGTISLVAADPANGSSLLIRILLSNSSLQ